MPTYDPSGHPLLSAAAQRLSPPQLASEASAAELLLRQGTVTLADTAFEEGTAEYDRAKLAVVYQVNYQVAAGTEGEVFASRVRGARTESYRDRPVSPRAMQLVAGLITPAADEGEWPIAGGLR